MTVLVELRLEVWEGKRVKHELLREVLVEHTMNDP